MKLTPKQLALILFSLAVAFAINWLSWLLIMRHPEDIDAIYHFLVTICLAAPMILIGDRLIKSEIFH